MKMNRRNLCGFGVLVGKLASPGIGLTGIDRPLAALAGEQVENP